MRLSPNPGFQSEVQPMGSSLWGNFSQWKVLRLQVPEVSTEALILVSGELAKWHSGEESTCQYKYSGNVDSVPGSGRCPGGENGNPLQYSCLGDPLDWRPLAGYSLWSSKDLDTTEQMSTHTHRHTHTYLWVEWSRTHYLPSFSISFVVWKIRILAGIFTLWKFVGLYTFSLCVLYFNRINFWKMLIILFKCIF